jgi:molybdenum cofactor synthesis domain-containing protein
MVSRQAEARRERTCALIVVGNEILSGKVRDTNAYFAVRELRGIGVALKRIVVVADELKTIAEEVRHCAARFEIVITSGGVGPTHDDVTVEAVADAFGRELVTDPQLQRIVDRHFPARAEAVRLKMALVPQGAVLNVGGEIAYPVVQLENVYMLPGIPQLFEDKLRALKDRFATDPYFMRAMYVNAAESTIAGQLSACLERFPDLMLGSYPTIGDAQYRVKVTLESKDRAYVDAAFDHLIGLMPEGAVVKTE